MNKEEIKELKENKDIKYIYKIPFLLSVEHTYGKRSPQSVL